MKADQVLREQLLALLKGENAHMPFDKAVSGFPLEAINRRLPNATYTAWHLLEHMRIAQRDILEFVRDPHYVSPDFPAGYWPAPGEMATPGRWKKTIKAFRTDLEAVMDLVRDPKTKFFSPIPHARDYTVIREVLLVADHNAYHTAEIVAIRRLLGFKPIKEY